MDYRFLLDLAVLIFSAKAFGLLAKRVGAPQVVGEIIAGLIAGPAVLNIVQLSDILEILAEIGVIMLMFSAGLSTDLKEMVKSGPKALFIACMGVFVPLVGGFLLYGAFNGFPSASSPDFYSAVFIGTILTATSVSITVAALSEMGRLNSEAGTAIVNAAIIDDVIGMIVLTCVLGESSGSNEMTKVILNILLFIVLAIVLGFIVNRIMALVDKKYPHTQRIPIYSLAFCFLLSYIAQHYFGIADITGAYIAGIVLCTIQDAGYVERKIDISSYMLFGPVFFASIGLKTDLSGMTMSILGFGICFIAVALVTKIVGCGLAARIPCGSGSG